MPQKEFENIAAVNRFLKLQISKEKDLQEIVELAASICETPYAMINLLDHETQHIKFSVGIQPTEIGYENGFCPYTIKQCEVLVIPDATKDHRFANDPFVTNSPKIRFYAGAPLTTGDGINLGTLCVLDGTAKELSNLQVHMLKSLSRQIIHLMEFETSLTLLKDQVIDSKKTENSLKAFFENSSSQHLLLDPQLKVLSFNKALSDIVFSISHKPLIMDMDIADYIHPDFLQLFIKNCKLALKGKSVKQEFHLDLPDGRICILGTFDPARNPDQEIIGISYNATDITKSIEHEELLVLHNESIQRIEHIQKTDLVEAINSVNSLMNKIRANLDHAHIPEIQLLESSIKELNDKSTLIV